MDSKPLDNVYVESRRRPEREASFGDRTVLMCSVEYAPSDACTHLNTGVLLFTFQGEVIQVLDASIFGLG